MVWIISRIRRYYANKNLKEDMRAALIGHILHHAMQSSNEYLNQKYNGDYNKALQSWTDEKAAIMGASILFTVNYLLQSYYGEPGLSKYEVGLIQKLIEYHKDIEQQMTDRKLV